MFFFIVLRPGAFPGKKVLSPDITNVIQDQPSSNIQEQPSRGVVKKGKRCLEVIKIA